MSICYTSWLYEQKSNNLTTPICTTRQMDKRLSRKRDLLSQQYYVSSPYTENSSVLANIK